MTETLGGNTQDLHGRAIDELAEQRTGRFRDKTPDWEAFADARVDGFRRAQHRFIGAGGSGKVTDKQLIPASGFTLSIMYVEPGQGNASHTHEVEEVFFVLKGTLTVFLEDNNGNRATRRIGPWELVSCPPDVIHGYINDSLEPVYFQVMLGKGKPELMGYTDPKLFAERDAHLRSNEQG